MYVFLSQGLFESLSICGSRCSFVLAVGIEIETLSLDGVVGADVPFLCSSEVGANALGVVGEGAQELVTNVVSSESNGVLVCLLHFTYY